MGDYDNVIIVAPLWWNNMAAPLQTFLFKYGAEMNGKHIGLIVSSGESSIDRIIGTGTSVHSFVSTYLSVCHEVHIYI